MALVLPLPTSRAARGKHKQLALPGVPVAEVGEPLAWRGEALAGRIVELSGSTGRTSTAVSMLLAAQREGESVVWIEPTDGPLYPPDLAAAGVDLDALVIVRVPTKEGPEGLCRVAEWLVRSGGFGLVVMDLMGRAPAAHHPWQTRLSGLLRRHDAQLCVLSDSEAAAPSLGAMVALRLEPQRHRDEDGSFVLSQRVLKNKIGALQGPSPERRAAPAGLEALPLADTPDESSAHAQLSLFDVLEHSEPAPLSTRRSVLPLGPAALPAVPPVVLRPKIAAKRVGAGGASSASPEHGSPEPRASSRDSAARRDGRDHHDGHDGHDGHDRHDRHDRYEGDPS